MIVRGKGKWFGTNLCGKKTQLFGSFTDIFFVFLFLPLSSFYIHAKLILVEFIELLGGGKDKQICQNAAANQNRIG